MNSEISAPFFIFAAPRSRTKWLSVFLTVKGWHCHHDLIAKLADTGKILQAMDHPMTGLADTGAAHGWRMIRDHYPDARFVVVRRNRDDIETSLELCGVKPGWVDWTIEDRLAEITAAGAMTVEFGDLDSAAIIANIYEYCLQERWDATAAARWMNLRHKIIEIDMSAHLAMLAENAEKLTAMKAAAKVYDRAFNPA